MDSTVSGIEGIDWLAAQRSPEIAAEVAALTRDAMEGRIPLEWVYGRRLSIVKPARSDVEALGDAYVEALAPGAGAAIAELARNGVQVHLISGGIAQAVLRIAAAVGLPERSVHAVTVEFDDAGGYSGYDEQSPLTTQAGKRKLLEQLCLRRPVLMVGDGMTDIETLRVVDAFAAFTGFCARPAVIAAAHHTAGSFDDLLQLILG